MTECIQYSILERYDLRFVSKLYVYNYAVNRHCIASWQPGLITCNIIVMYTAMSNIHGLGRRQYIARG